jgi:hypothetical protein
VGNHWISHRTLRCKARRISIPTGFGDQVADPKPPQAAAVKSRGGERCGKAGTMIPTGMVREASASEPLQKRRKQIM